MTILSPLKALPLLAVLAAGFSPGLALAEKHDGAKYNGQQHSERRAHSNRRDSQSVDHRRVQRNNNRHYEPRRIVHNRHYVEQKHVHSRYCQHHTNSRSYAYQPQRFISRNALGIMLGIHSDNFDIVFHD